MSDFQNMIANYMNTNILKLLFTQNVQVLEVFQIFLLNFALTIGLDQSNFNFIFIV